MAGKDRTEQVRHSERRTPMATLIRDRTEQVRHSERRTLIANNQGKIVQGRFYSRTTYPDGELNTRGNTRDRLKALVLLSEDTQHNTDFTVEKFS